MPAHGRSLGRGQGEERQGAVREGSQKIRSPIVFAVSADLEKPNGKESDHLSESITWYGLQERTHKQMQPVPLDCLLASLSLYHSILLTSVLHLTVII